MSVVFFLLCHLSPLWEMLRANVSLVVFGEDKNVKSLLTDGRRTPTFSPIES